jgi:arginyl-tRNA synthetase
MSILAEIKTRFRRALSDLAGDPDELLDLIRRGQDPKFGDYQANMAMPLGKRLGRPPREVAAEVIARLDLSDICHAPEIAGPGFINLRLRDDWLAGRLQAAIHDPRLGIPPVRPSRTFVIDFSAPNVAKPMHVGHIRSTVIGDALCRALRFTGHRAISDNHIGDWGTQFGMILYGYRHFLDQAAYGQNPVAELARLYRLVRRLMDLHVAQPPSAVWNQPTQPGASVPQTTQPGAAVLQTGIENHSQDDEEFQETDPAFLELAAKHGDVASAVLLETAKLHAGDPENRRLWQEFLPFCQDEIDRMYRRLDIAFDHTLGESFYEDRLAAIVDELLARGIARESDGAIAVFLEGHETPMLIRKQDGAFLYATTDLATIRYRMDAWRPDAILYVVDHRQRMHFEHLFAAARLMGYRDVELQHISFGTVLGDDGRPFRTRSGDTVGLEGLLDEAVRRAHEVVSANDDAKPDGAELLPAERQRVAETVGIAALKYADLSQNRTSDYVFSYDKMLAMKGNTAAYMQYSYARVRSIFARGGVDAEALRASGASMLLNSPAERALGLELLRFGEALDLMLADYRPNQLTSYLFDLANRYSIFFEKCHVLRAENDDLRQSRLLLCDLTARTIQKGLELLGIKVVEKM